jgi:hypothetical protein
MLGATLLEKCLRTLLDFLRCEVFLVGGEKPNMPKRIFERTGAVTVKLILHRDGLGKQSIHILDVYVKANRRTAQ